MISLLKLCIWIEFFVLIVWLIGSVKELGVVIIIVFVWIDIYKAGLGSSGKLRFLLLAFSMVFAALTGVLGFKIRVINHYWRFLRFAFLHFSEYSLTNLYSSSLYFLSALLDLLAYKLSFFFDLKFLCFLLGKTDSTLCSCFDCLTHSYGPVFYLVLLCFLFDIVSCLLDLLGDTDFISYHFDFGCSDTEEA